MMPLGGVKSLMMVEDGVLKEDTTITPFSFILRTSTTGIVSSQNKDWVALA